MRFDLDAEGFQKIPHIEASEEQKRAFEKIMRRGNTVLKQHCERVNAKIGKRYSKAKFRIELFAALKTHTKGTLYVRGVPITNDDLNLVLAVRDIEWPVLCSLSKLIFQQANKWARRNHGSSLTFTDFYNEASMAVSDALYGFVKPKITFITYAQHAIHRRILNKVNENKPLCPWTQENKALYAKYQLAANEISSKLGYEVSLEEVADKLKLDDEQISALRDMQVRVRNHSEIAKDEQSDGDWGIYGAVSPSQNQGVDLDMLDSVEMNSWERAVVEAYMAGSRGWQTEVAQKHINPETGKPYSRRAPRLALRRVMERILSIHGKDLVEAA
jgi:DNA-directed RNA polymerase specialized sigma subunit